MFKSTEAHIGLSDNVIEAITQIFRKFPEVEKVVLYGSRAKGDFRKGSDIDLAIHGEKMDLAILYNIENEIDDLLLPYSMDISIHHKIENKDLMDHIDRVGILFYERD